MVGGEICGLESMKFLFLVVNLHTVYEIEKKYEKSKRSREIVPRGEQVCVLRPHDDAGAGCALAAKQRQGRRGVGGV